MERDYTEEQKFIKARKRVEEIKGFYTHIVVTILIIPFLVFINLKFVPQFHWFWFAAIGMILGVFFHWLGVFGFKNVLGKDWEEKKIREIMKEEDRERK
ncbi:2TM domain-containing protein [Pseudotenacibaculum sp. MALMAid0570]|uniref:2TM domain-containing protein n=1 Tax=Pseudotenacibaculum sp. MALMAid0570 TaxID=3143938 RepID=UPI0032DFC651